MTSPKHLWSGEWRHESDAAEAERIHAERERAQALAFNQQADDEPELPADSGLGARLRSLGGPNLSRTLVVVVAVLLIAGGAVALINSGGSSNSQNTTGSTGALAQNPPSTPQTGATPSPTPPSATPRPTPNPTPPSSQPTIPSTPPIAASSPVPLMGMRVELLPPGGVVIAAVTPNGPAELAGLQPGDVIGSVDNTPVRSVHDVTSTLHRAGAGNQVEIQVSRGSSILTTVATLARSSSSSP